MTKILHNHWLVIKVRDDSIYRTLYDVLTSSFINCAIYFLVMLGNESFFAFFEFLFQVGPESFSYSILTSSSTGLKVAKSQLQLKLEPHHFHEGLLVAKCVASMLTNHWQSSAINIKEESPTLASVVENGAKNETESKVGKGFNLPAPVSTSGNS